jgi:hypothetical protein
MHYASKSTNHSLYLIKLTFDCSYPEGNFGGNQLLDGSISLSPLYPNLTIDLHVRTAYEPPPEFPLASPYSGIVHHLSGPNMYAHTQTFLPKDCGRRIVPQKVLPLLLSLRMGVCHSYTCTYVRLLGPCFKTG